MKSEAQPWAQRTAGYVNIILLQRRLQDIRARGPWPHGAAGADDRLANDHRPATSAPYWTTAGALRWQIIVRLTTMMQERNTVETHLVIRWRNDRLADGRVEIDTHCPGVGQVYTRTPVE